MAVSFIGANSSHSGGGSTLNINVPAGAQSGDVIIAYMNQNYSGSRSDESIPTAFLETHEINPNGNGSQTDPPPFRLGWLRLASSLPSSYTFQTDPGCNYDCGLIVLRGVVTTGSPYANTPTFNNGSSTTVTANSTTGDADNMLLALFGKNHGANLGSWSTVPSGMTLATRTNNVDWSSAQSAYQLLTSTGSTGNKSCTHSISSGYTAALVVIKSSSITAAPQQLQSATNISRPAIVQIPKAVPRTLQSATNVLSPGITFDDPIAATVVGVTQAQGNLSDNVICNVPAGTQAGDVIFAFMDQDQDGSLANFNLEESFTDITEYESGSQPAAKVGFLRLIAAPPASYTFDADPLTRCNVFLVTCRNVNDEDIPIRTKVPSYTGQNNFSSTSHVAASVVASVGDLLLGHFARDVASVPGEYSATPPTGMTLGAVSPEGTFENAAIYYQGLTSDTNNLSGTKTATHTLSAGRGEASILLSVLPRVGDLIISASTLEVAPVIQQPTVVQTHVVNPDPIVADTNISAIEDFFTTHNVTPNTLQVATAMLSPSASDEYIPVFPSDMTVQSEILGPLLVQQHFLTVDDMQSSSTISTPSALTIGTIYGLLLSLEYEERTLFVGTELRLLYVNEEVREIILETN